MEIVRLHLARIGVLHNVPVHGFVIKRREHKVAAEWFDFAGARFELLDGDAQIAEGVRVVATPGHTIGHQSVVVDTADGGALMIGDAAYTSHIYLAGDDVDLEDWRGQYADKEAWSASLHRLRALHSHAVHFCHDTRILGPDSLLIDSR